MNYEHYYAVDKQKIVIPFDFKSHLDNNDDTTLLPQACVSLSLRLQNHAFWISCGDRFRSALLPATQYGHNYEETTLAPETTGQPCQTLELCTLTYFSAIAQTTQHIESFATPISCDILL